MADNCDNGKQKAHKKAVLTQTPASVGNPQSIFDVKQFNDFIWKNGYECFIERRIYCPCTNVNTGQWLPDCLNCGGTGKVYINKQESRIACTSMSNRNKYESWSIVNMGVVNISAMAPDKMGFEDRVTLPELEMIFSEVVQLKLNVNETKVFAFTKYFPKVVYDVYRFKDINSPLVWVDPDYYKIKDNHIIFDYNQFFPLLQAGQLNVSIRYSNHPQYLIIDINRDMVKTLSGKDCNTVMDGARVNAPLNYVGRLLHIMSDQPSLNGKSLFDNTNYDVTPQSYDV